MAGASRGRKPPAPARAGQEARLNRMLLLGGAALSLGAILLALISHPFDPARLGINLAVIVVGLAMGRGIGRFLFRGVAPGK
jgi:hypothetical protein